MRAAVLTKAVASIMRRGLLPQDGFSWSVGLITLWQVHAAASADSVGAVLKAPLHHAVSVAWVEDPVRRAQDVKLLRPLRHAERLHV